jgi:septal ring factor EnvC (AmiA/AmiB activator)
MLQEIAEREGHLEAVRRDLAEQFAALENHRQEFGQWIERQQADVQHQASRLVAREQELDRQQQHYEELESRWQIERGEYQAEIRRLLAALRDLELDGIRAA